MILARCTQLVMLNSIPPFISLIPHCIILEFQDTVSQQLQLNLYLIDDNPASNTMHQSQIYQFEVFLSQHITL